MNEFGIGCCGVTFQVYSDIADYDSFVEQAGTILPNMRPTCQEPSFRVGILRGCPEAHYGEHDLIVRGDYSSDQVLRDAIMASSHYLERELNARGRFSIHSSAIIRNGCAVVLAGEGGTGKTTSALRASMMDPDIHVVSGDRSVIDFNALYGGTTKLVLKKGSLLYELPGLFPIDECSDPWTELHTFWTRVLDTPVSLDAIILPRKFDCDLKITCFEGERKFLRINGNIAPFSDAHPNVMLGQMRPLQYFNTQETRQRRIDFAARLAERVPVIGLVGRLDDIAGYASEYFCL